VLPRGSWKFVDGVYEALTVTIQIEAAPIADNGDFLAGYSVLDELVLGGDTGVYAHYYTQTYALAAGRWAIRCTRTDTKDPDTTAAHTVEWAGLRGYLATGARSFDMTTIALRMKATAGLTSTNARTVNVLATRMLPIWNGSAMVGLTATRNPCDAFAEICRSSNGGRIADAEIDLAGIYAPYADFAAPAGRSILCSTRQTPCRTRCRRSRAPSPASASCKAARCAWFSIGRSRRRS
jgi:hypothetical protein